MQISAPYWTIFISWALILAGWYVVNLLQRLRDRSETLRATLVEIRTALLELRKDAITYHTETRDLYLERALLFDIQCFITTFQKLAPAMGVPEYETNNACIALRQAITSVHFYNEHRGKLEATDKLLSKIDRAVFDMRAIINDSYIDSVESFDVKIARRIFGPKQDLNS